MTLRTPFPPLPPQNITDKDIDNASEKESKKMGRALIVVVKQRDNRLLNFETIGMRPVIGVYPGRSTIDDEVLSLRQEIVDIRDENEQLIITSNDRKEDFIDLQEKYEEMKDQLKEAKESLREEAEEKETAICKLKEANAIIAKLQEKLTDKHLEVKFVDPGDCSVPVLKFTEEKIQEIKKLQQTSQSAVSFDGQIEEREHVMPSEDPWDKYDKVFKIEMVKFFDPLEIRISNLILDITTFDVNSKVEQRVLVKRIEENMWETLPVHKRIVSFMKKFLKIPIEARYGNISGIKFKETTT